MLEEHFSDSYRLIPMCKKHKSKRRQGKKLYFLEVIWRKQQSFRERKVVNFAEYQKLNDKIR